MDLRDVDLNLLVVLDVVLEERKLVSAARRLGMAQPSVSGALDRCRKLFGDRLLVRAGRGMELTARGQALREPIRALLTQARAVIGAPPDELATVERTVRIVSTDIPALTLLQILWEQTRRTAPGISLVLLHWRESEDVIDALARDQADVAISVLPQAGSGFVRTELYVERYCVAMRRGHPAAQDFDLDRWLAFPHVVLSARGSRRTPLDDQLALLGRRRRVGITVPSFLMVPPLLLASDLIAMLPRACMHHEPELHYCEPPIAVEGFPLHLAVANRAQGDVAVAHVAALIRDHFPGQP
ncbi:MULTISPECIES: LysR family transcriptional regulator [Alphaproteobacteria]|uniref:LysR family transcriptional regulator n=1 Tax=Methylobacterium currus TaxID=2051553 RepID=A0A2R4WW52_9HYPH|nr:MULTISPECIES: LysR family transcriptional regulator [Alphaproteobacteria]AWB25764.1 LysR family transcriptional regulator [Methylobacterium currus]MBX3478205.1 LysR family transcriptional regulator [Brevundimonas sp.]NGM32812.1 LysR family transcriptional regulator [Methylobacterium sp. DB0501]